MKKFLLIFASLVVCVVSADRALACSCRSSPPSEALKIAEAVFIGKVTKELTPKRKWTVTVSKVIKGSVKQRITLYASMPGTSCELSNWQVGETYLFFANQIEAREVAGAGGQVHEQNKEKIGGYESNVCSWSRTLSYVRSSEFKKVLSDHKDEKFLTLIEKGKKPNK